ncbi:MAG: hypothetical protein NTU61_03240 [Candidatus Altiarchaeota archaeon]|nr:hypothetical protein [Candidatus Altiarchaeota archaeon]
MKNKILPAFLILLLAGIAQAASQQCETNYDECITTCCENCGSHTDYDNKGDLVCDVGSTQNLKQECIEECLPCSTEYQDCASQPDNEGAGCCCISIVVPLVTLLTAAIAKA